MPDPDKDEVARALERMSSGQSDAPRPQPKPRAGPQPKAPAAKSAARPPAQKAARPAAPASASAKRAQAPQPRAAPLAELAKLGMQSSRANRGRAADRPSSLGAGMGLRRTLIPILLTGGVLLIALAVVHYAWNSIDNPMLELPRGIVFALFLCGGVCWLLAAANMFAVDRKIRKPKQEA